MMMREDVSAPVLSVMLTNGLADAVRLALDIEIVKVNDDIPWLL